MFKNKFVKIGIVIAFAVAAIYSLSKSQPEFDEQTNADRAEYLQNMLSMNESPVASLEGFSVFNYFPPDESWVFQAEFESDPSGESFPIYMTDGSMEELPMAGRASFEKDGETVRLLIFDEGETLLLPFRDETNGVETYGGGRYINLDKTANNRLTIDFNKAHNFYCAYNESFICPVPPPANTVKLRIEAGEKILK